MTSRYTISGVSRLNEQGTRASRVFVHARRRGSASRPRPERLLPETLQPRFESHTSGYETVEQILKDILRSAAQVLGAEQGFFLVSRSEAVLELAQAQNIRPAEVIDTVLSKAALPVHASLREKKLAGADFNGDMLPIHDGLFENNSPAILCVPLDLGLRQSGVLCLLRRHQLRKLTGLDLEIVQALAEQAALAIGAASHSSALSRLEASLSAPAYA